MATTGKGIATQLNANNLYTSVMGSGAVLPYQDASQRNRCITYASAIAAGFTVNNASSYTDKRLVKYSDLSVDMVIFILNIDISDDADLYNKGPITLIRNINDIDDINTLSYARDVESTDMEQHTNRVPVDYSSTHGENLTESTESNMALSTADEVLHVAQEFEKQDNILQAGIGDTIGPIDPPVLPPDTPAVPDYLGLILTVIDDPTAAYDPMEPEHYNNLLDSSMYGPAEVSTSNGKTISYTLFKTSIDNIDGPYFRLYHDGSAKLRNNEGTCAEGRLINPLISDAYRNQTHTITVDGPGIYTFNAYWRPATGVEPL